MQPDVAAKLDAAITRTAEALADGFDVGDVALIVKEAVEVAEAFDDLDNSERKALAIAFCERLVDEFFSTATPALSELIAAIDIPYVPEGVEVAVIDPLLSHYAPSILKPAIKAMLPKLVDLVVDAADGDLAVNQEN